METTPLLAPSGGAPLSQPVNRRFSHSGPFHHQVTVVPLRQRRFSASLHVATPSLVPAMGELGSFLFLSNLITGACVRVGSSARRACATPLRVYAAVKSALASLLLISSLRA